MAKKRTFSAMIEIPATLTFDVEIEWTKKQDPTEEEICEAYRQQSKGFTFTENGTDEDVDASDVTDIQES